MVHQKTPSYFRQPRQRHLRFPTTSSAAVVPVVKQEVSSKKRGQRTKGGLYTFLSFKQAWSRKTVIPRHLSKESMLLMYLAFLLASFVFSFFLLFERSETPPSSYYYFSRVAPRIVILEDVYNNFHLHHQR
jgi:hypothetical protein